MFCFRLPGAPLRQALLDAGIGKDVDGGYNDGIYQPFFTVEVKSAEEKDKEKFLQVIRETLEKLVKEGIDQKAIAAGINYLEFRFRESDYGSYPRGLSIALMYVKAGCTMIINHLFIWKN